MTSPPGAAPLISVVDDDESVRESLPDFLVFAALPLKLAGVPVLLDLHEAMPEFFASRFPGASNRMYRSP